MSKLDTSLVRGTWAGSIARVRAILTEIGVDTDEAESPLSAYGTIRALGGRYPVLPGTAYHDKDYVVRWTLDNAVGGRVALIASPKTGYFSSLVATPADVSADRLVRQIVRSELERDPKVPIGEGWEEMLSTVLQIARQKADSVEVQPWDLTMEVGKTPASLADELGLEYELFGDNAQAMRRAKFPVPVADKHAQALVLRGVGHTYLIVYGDASQLSKFSRQLLTPAG